MSNLLNHMKWMAGKLSAQIAESQLNIVGVARAALHRRRGRPAEATLLASLVVGSLMDKGLKDQAELYTIALSKLAEEDRCKKP